MPLFVYIQIIEKEDISFIVESGEYTEDEIAQAWDDFQQEYGELTGGESVLEYMIKASKLTRSQHKLNALYGIRSLWFLDKKFCNKKLKEIGVHAKTLRQLDINIHNEIGQLKTFNNDLIEGTEEKTDYYDLISMINQNTGANINIKVDTVRMFCSHLKTFHKLQQEKEKAHDRR